MKSKDITKFDPEWQMIRVSVKGNKTSIPHKLEIVDNFFENNPSRDNQERVINWLGGLWKGIKNFASPEIGQLVQKYMAQWGMNQNLPKEQPKTPEETREILLTHPLSLRLDLWKDLFARTKGWGSYLHKEQDSFMKVLATTIPEQAFKNGSSFADYNRMIENPGEGNWKGVY